MAEAEDVITDAARHLTEFSQTLWRKHRPRNEISFVMLADLARDIELLITAVFGSPYRIRASQAPAPPTLLARLFRPQPHTGQRHSLPATDGVCIWLPVHAGTSDMALGRQRYRVAALQQAVRSQRGSVLLLPQADQGTADFYLLLESFAADRDLVRLLPGMAPQIAAARLAALKERPAQSSLSVAPRQVEQLVQAMLRAEINPVKTVWPVCETPGESLHEALRLNGQLLEIHGVLGEHRGRYVPLFKDWWTGELRPPEPPPRPLTQATDAVSSADVPRPEQLRSTRLPRRPRVRENVEDQDEQPGAFMVQTAQPHEHAEDPFGMQRPTDRDQQTGLDDFAESLSDLPEAQLVRTPERARDFFLSDDLLTAQSADVTTLPATGKTAVLVYPEWDYRLGHYRAAGASVHCAPAPAGSADWVRHTLAVHAASLEAIRRRFEMLRAEPSRQRRQLDGDEIDLDACIERHADLHSGQTSDHGLYQTRRVQDRDIAVSLLIDVSGSTDAWISGTRRVIDVAREALLLVCLALERTEVRYAVQAFSGETRHDVVVRDVKHFDEAQSMDIALRIAALEPEYSTRAGAALRHAATGLMKQTSAHRLLLLLSDGRPNDVDEYEGRYGVEDTRQAVAEARMQGISVFCLTIDRNYSAYLPRIFGRDYAVLKEAERLPAVLLDWMKTLMSR